MSKKQEILSAIRQDLPKEIVEKVIYELDDMEITENLDGKSCLEEFYSTWQKRKNESPKDINIINSWTAYALGLVTKKPQDNDVFMPPRRIFARPTPPDIDSDFDYNRRGEVYEYLIEKYGRKRVGNIGTYGGLKLKSCLRRLGKVLDVAGSFSKGEAAYVSENELKVSEIVETLPKSSIIKVTDEDGKSKVINTISEACEYFPDFKYYIDKHPDILKYGKELQDVETTYGVHASGICISELPLSGIAPLRKAKDKAGKEVFATQYSCDDLEFIGLIKFDILAISTLTVIDATVKMIKDNYGIELDIPTLPLDDKKTLDLYKSGKLVGVFQCEGRGMQKTMQEIGVDRFDDIMAAIALYRPGPMASIPEYCARKKGMKKIL